MYIKFVKPLFLVVIFIFTFACCHMYSNSYAANIQKDLAGSVIRFHVLANSDSTEDQQLKMKVKEAVVSYIYDETKSFSKLDETREFLLDNSKTITAIAQKTVMDNGYDYCVSSNLGLSDFPDKSYGDVTFPAGTYESFTISIGDGNGHNWWCVLYPPLCFVDASTGVLPDDSKEMLKDSLNEDEYNCISKDTPAVTFKFKFLPFFN